MTKGIIISSNGIFYAFIIKDSSPFVKNILQFPRGRFPLKLQEILRLLPFFSGTPNNHQDKRGNRNDRVNGVIDVIYDRRGKMKDKRQYNQIGEGCDGAKDDCHRIKRLALFMNQEQDGDEKAEDKGDQKNPCSERKREIHGINKGNDERERPKSDIQSHQRNKQDQKENCQKNRKNGKDSPVRVWLLYAAGKKQQQCKHNPKILFFHFCFPPLVHGDETPTLLPTEFPFFTMWRFPVLSLRCSRYS